MFINDSILVKEHQCESIIGVDEVGRGCLAGDVYAAAVIKNPMAPWPDGINDSKKLLKSTREMLSVQIQKDHYFYIGIATVEEIDEINILQASFLAMRRALFGLLNKHSILKYHILVDGQFRIPDIDKQRQTPIIQGDSKVKAIAAASIIAKVARDLKMTEMENLFPQYGFSKHKGYSTVLHKNKIRELGPCSLHRKTFAGVKEYVDHPSFKGSTN